MQIDSAAIKARNRLIAAFVGLSLLDTVLVILAQDVWAVGRIIITIVLMHFTLQGKRWAKWMLIGLLSLTAVALLGLLTLLSSDLSTVLTIGSIVMIAIALAIILILLRSRTLNRYFARQRQLHSA